MIKKRWLVVFRKVVKKNLRSLLIQRWLSNFSAKESKREKGEIKKVTIKALNVIENTHRRYSPFLAFSRYY